MGSALGLVPHQLKLGDVRDIFDAREVAQSAQKAREVIAKAATDRRFRRTAMDEAPRSETKRRPADQPASDRISRGQNGDSIRVIATRPNSGLPSLFSGRGSRSQR
jgi:hypothetical protein